MLITGALGFIGLNLLKITDGIPMDIKNGDDCTQATPWNALYRGGPIIHLAAESGVPQSIENPVKSFWNNVGGTFQALEMARSNNARLIFASSSAADLNNSPYAASKAAGEAYCQAYGACYDLSYAALRFSNVYGPYSDHKTSCVANMIKGALFNNEIIVHGSGEQVRDFIYVNDVCELILEFANGDETGVFDICTGVQTPIKKVAEIISGLTGAKITYVKPREDSHPTPKLRSRPVMTELEEGIEKTLDYFSV